MESPEPGVRLLGQASRFSELKVGNVFLPSRDGKHLYLGAAGKLLKVQASNLETEAETATELSYIQKIAASPNGQLAVIGYRSPPIDPDNPVAMPLKHGCVLFDEDMEIDRVVEFSQSDEPNRDFLVSLRFSLDGEQLLVIGQQTTRLIDVDSGDTLASQTDLFDEKGCFLEDDLILFPRIRKVWNTVSNKVSSADTLNDLELPRGNSYLLIHDTEPLFAFSDPQEKRIQLVNYRSGDSLASIEAEDLQLYQGDFSADGRWMVACCYSQDFRSTALAVFDLQKEKLETIARFKKQRFVLPSFAGKESIMIYDYNTSRLSQVAMDDQLATHLQLALNQPAATNQLTVNHDGTRAIGNYGRQDIDLLTGEIDSDQPQFSRQVFFGPQGQLVRSLDNDALQIEPPRGKSKRFGLPKKTKVVNGLLSLLGSSEASNDRGYTLVVGTGLDQDGEKLTCLYQYSDDATVRYIQWDANSRKTLFDNPIPDQSPERSSGIGLIAAIHPDGKSVYYLQGTTIRRLDMKRGTSRDVLNLEQVPQRLLFNRDGSLLAASFSAQNMGTGTNIKIFRPEAKEIETELNFAGELFAFAADADRLAVATRDHREPVRVLDTKTWEPVVTHTTNHANRMAVALSGDGSQLLFSLVDSRLEIWDLGELE